MASITDLALYISTGRCIVWIGSGPSIEMGLPGWRRLANEVLEACRKKQRHGFKAIEAFYREGKYPEMFDEVELTYGRPFLLDTCNGLLHEPSGEGLSYKVLANLDFLAYFTTNYDNLLLRHIEQAGKAFTKYLNCPEDLSAVDVDVTPALVKLHGDLTSSDNMVLTRGDYRRLYVSGKGSGFQTFLQAFLTLQRFLFVGYSMNDPEVLQLQEEIQSDLRRKVRSIAILANVPDHEMRRWDLDYNIDVLRYSAVDQDHSELTAILASVKKVLSVGRIAKEMNTAEELKRAEALYLWYRFSSERNEMAAVDALQSVVLSMLLDCPDGMNIECIKGQLTSDMGVQMTTHERDLEGSIEQLVQSEWVLRDAHLYKVEPDKQAIIRSYERRFEDMMKTFDRQVTLDAVNLFGVDEKTGHKFSKLLIETLIDIFENRGREILQIAFEDSPISPSGALELIETVWRRANRLEDPTDKPRFVRLVLTTMFDPVGIYGSVLNYFAKAFFCIQALGTNKTVKGIVADVIGNRALLIDANILIPLTARNEDRNEFITAVLEACRAAGIRLYTTQSSLDEVRRHASWALELTKEFGTVSTEVMYAATGQGDYAANAFLKGFIAVDPDSRDRSFQQYLRDCFGGSYAKDRFDDYFPDRLGITVIDQDILRELKMQYRQEFDDAVSKISQWNFQRKEEERKSALRINGEAEAFIAVTHWDTLSDLSMEVCGSRCSYLTYGTTVGRLGTNAPSSTRMVSVQPEVVWEVLTTFDRTANADLPDFRSLMHASYFRMSDHFIDKERYRTFFRPVIDAAKARLQSMHPFIRDILGITLPDEHLDSYPVEDLPAVLSSVESVASYRASVNEALTQKVIDENEHLRAQLREYQDQEAKRKQFVARQRRQEKERRTIQRSA